VGVVGGFGFDEAAVGRGVFDEGGVHPAEAFGGAGDGELGFRSTAEAGEHHFGRFLGDVVGGCVDFIRQDGG
jgi:hypothetical protein